jgi:hypothetical protein
MEDALLQASRILNWLLPPWTAAIVMAMSYRWSGGRRAALAGGVAAGALTVLSPPAMSMALEFQKNALGLVWMAAALWVSASAMQRRGVREWAILVGVMVLSVLTDNKVIVRSSIAGLLSSDERNRRKIYRFRPRLHAEAVAATGRGANSI